MVKRISISVGDIFGYLKVLEILGLENGRRFVSCVCQCGKICKVRYNSLKAKDSKSCGCKTKEMISNSGTKHGSSASLTYSSWVAMKQRCYNPKVDLFDYYGGKGIEVCDEWRDSFDKFLEDMGERPNKSFTLNRLDSNKNYYKENCEWASKSKQVLDRELIFDLYPGIRKYKNRFQVRIVANGKCYSLGTFSNYLDALEVRILAELEFFGTNRHKIPIRY